MSIRGHRSSTMCYICVMGFPVLWKLETAQSIALCALRNVELEENMRGRCTSDTYISAQGRNEFPYKDIPSVNH